MEIKVIADEWMMPERQHQDDAGADLKADAPGGSSLGARGWWGRAHAGRSPAATWGWCSPAAA